jgi:hypothetical protein
MELLRGIGILMAYYGVYGMVKGEIYAKDGITARYFYRDEESAAFWSACIGYVVIGGLVVGAITNRLS